MQNCRYNIETRHSYSKKKGHSYNRYCNDILTFDIEVTSAWIDEKGEIIGYEKGRSAEYWNNLIPLALCYIWQFSFNDTVYYGRELRDFEKVLKDLPSENKYVIWVHNLAYEFHFLNNFLTWKNVFAKSPHKPMKCTPAEYPNIEFRCSYMLTRLSLDSWGKQIGWHKDTGDLDYEIIRTPLTPLTDKEMKYCEDDCLVVYHGIIEYLKEYKTVRNIPLTQTGTVRRVVKEKLTSDIEYRRFIKKLLPKDAEEYEMLMDVFAGGYTHANRFYADHTVTGYIEHYDFASSYPSVMICEKYPMSKWMFTGEGKFPTDEEMEKYAFILDLEFTNIRCTHFNTYIQANKSIGKGMIYDNGRVIKADELRILVTEQDWQTIRETYTWDTCEIIEKYRAKKEYLPKAFVEYILELYHNKTTLKDVAGMEDLYMQSKQYINSMFGMTVTAIVQPEVKFDGKEWSVSNLDEDIVTKRLDKLRDWHDKERRCFLSYSWGCWITAYARRNLWKCIIDCDTDCVYCDTDSIFVNGKHDFTWYNDEIDAKMLKACQTLGIDFEKTRPKTVKGKEKPLGRFVPEDPCKEFRTLGAKRYVERRIEDDKLHLTVSGINKEAVDLLDNDINNFQDGFDFDKDADCVKKQLATYLTGIPEVTYPDGYHSTYTQGINMRRTGYLLTMTDEYKEILELSTLVVEDFDERGLMRMKTNYHVVGKEKK